MNLLSGNLSVRLELSLASLLPQALVAAAAGANCQSPHSPDSSIEGDKSEVEELSLKKSSKVKLNGHMTQVVEAQINCNRSNGTINAAAIKMETI